MTVRGGSLLAACALAAGLMMTPPAAGYNPKTHRHVTQTAAGLLESTDADGLYAEAYEAVHVAAMGKGSMDEDYGSVAGNARGYRHYYDPDGQGAARGLRYQNYFKAWWAQDEVKRRLGATIHTDFGYEGIEVTPPEEGYYPPAVEWATDGAGTDDVMNWRGALQAYDYTARSREEAYLRLGHVVHLLQDMAEPDHAMSIPHPGSDFEVPAALATGDTSAKGTRFGYEAFIQANIDKLTLAAAKVQRRATLKAYFDETARTAKKSIAGKTTVPLGLDMLVVTVPNKDLTGYEESDVAILPTIDPADAESSAVYLQLADKLLTHALEMTAGVYEDFHDIVNQPPYVRSVTIEQAGAAQGRYEARWTDICESPDGTVDFCRRRAATRRSTALAAGVAANVVIEFGPDAERIDPATVKVRMDRQAVQGRMTGPSRWEGKFTPRLPGRARRCRLPMEIEASDVHRHYPRLGLADRGYELDADPSSPAVLCETVAPYDWGGYEPGRDTTHAVMVVGAGAGAEGPAPAEVHLGRRDASLVVAFEAMGEDGKAHAGVRHLDGTVIVKPQFDNVYEFFEGVARVEVNRKSGYINEAGRWVVKPTYDMAWDFSEGLANVCRMVPNPDRLGWKKEQWGFVDRAGRVAIPLEFENLPHSFSGGLAQATENWKWSKDPLGGEHLEYRGKPGYIDPHGNWAFTGEFGLPGRFSQGLAAVQVEVEKPDGGKDEKFGYVDKTGHMVMAPQFDKADPFYLGYAKVTVELGEPPRWIDRGGNLQEGVFRYPLAGQKFRDGLSPHSKNDTLGYINPHGRFVIAPKYHEARPFSEGLAAIAVGEMETQRWGFINAKGEEVVPPKYYLVGDFSEGLAVVATGKQLDDAKFGYIDSQGREVVELKYTMARAFHEGLAAVAVGGWRPSTDTAADAKWGFIDKTGRAVIEPQFDAAEDFSEGLAMARVAEPVRAPRGGVWRPCGYINREGKFVIAPQFSRGWPFSEGLALTVGMNGPLRFIDKTGKTAFEGQWRQVGRFSEGLCAVRGGPAEWKGWGYIDSKGETVIPPMFETADEFYEGAALVRAANIEAFIDRLGGLVPRQEVARVLDKDGGEQP